MNFNANVLPPVASELPRLPKTNGKKLQENLDVTEMTLEVLAAAVYVRQFTRRNNGEYNQEVLELTLGIVGKDLTITRKIRGAILDGNGQAGATPAQLWDTLNIMASQRPDFMSNAVDAVNYSDQCTMYPNMVGCRFSALVATTSRFNGFNCYSVYLFHPQTRASGYELAQNIQTGASYASAKDKITEDRATFVAKTSTGGGWGAAKGFGATQGQAQPQAPKTMLLTNPPQVAPQTQPTQYKPVGNYQGGGYQAQAQGQGMQYQAQPQDTLPF